MQFPTTFFGWVGFLIDQYGGMFLRGTGVTLLIALSGTVLGFLIGDRACAQGVGGQKGAD